MTTETISTRAETLAEPHYDYKSFELVFSKFCGQYGERLKEFEAPASIGDSNSFMGLPPKATLKDMGLRLYEVASAMGQPPKWEDSQDDDVSTKEAILLSARYLAWQATMGSITQQYIDRVKDKIDDEKARHSDHNIKRQNLDRLFREQEKAVTILLAQNHALRDYFDSGLAKRLGNDSPEKIQRLLDKLPYLDDDRKEGLARGISLEIASKRFVENLLKQQGKEDLTVAFGSDDQDSRGGDLVIYNGEDIFFIDVKSSMPKKFTGGEASTPEDYQRGYKWLDSRDNERKVVVWAYLELPVEPSKFKLADMRLANNLALVANSAKY